MGGKMVLAMVLALFLGITPELAGATSGGGDAAELLAQAERLQREFAEAEALALYEAVLAVEPDNCQALKNAAFLHLRLGWLYSSKEARRTHYRQLLAYAERARQLRPDEQQIRVLHLAARAKTASDLGRAEQVELVRELHRELATLTTARQEDPDCLYLFSWLNFKVGQIPPLERFLAGLLFGGLPEDLSTGRAIGLMERALSLRPDSPVYHYDLGLFFQQSQEPVLARRQYEKVLTLPDDSPEARVYRQRAAEKLRQLGEDTLAARVPE